MATGALEGTLQADPLHAVVANNHGSISYITLEQSHVLVGLAAAAAVFVGLMIAIDLAGVTSIKGKSSTLSSPR